MDELQAFVSFLTHKYIDCAALRRAIDAAEGVDLSRVLWSLAHARHTRDIELYKNDMSNECQQVIQRVADLCAMQAHTDVAPEAWWASQADTATAARAATCSAAAHSAFSAGHSVFSAAHAASSSASAAYAAASSISSAAAMAVAREAAVTTHYEWERDALIELLKELAKN